MFRSLSTAAIALLLSVVLTGFSSAQDFHSQNNSAELLTLAAKSLMNSLTEEQQAKALFEVGSEEWTNFAIIPWGPNGLKFEEMKQGQISLFHAVMSAGLSRAGYHKAASIIALEEYLVEMELAATGESPDFHGTKNYNFAIFGTPLPGATWSIRIHGHHLYLSFGVQDGEIVSTGPSYFGAQPNEVIDGPRKGWYVLHDEQNQGRDLFLSLNADQRKAAIIADEMPNDVFSGNNVEIHNLKSDKGVWYGDLNEKQQDMLKALVMEHVYDVPQDLAHLRIEKINRGGWSNIRFSWIGSTKSKEKMYYRAEGPEFMVEYCVTAVGENHIHTVWREFDGDFGRDILADHFKSSPH